MGTKGNGSLNGSGGEDRDENGEKIVRFPTLAERDRLRKKQEKEWRAQYKADNRAKSVPFMNIDRIPVFTRVTFVSFLLVHLCLFFFTDPASRLLMFYTFGFVPGYFTGVLVPVPLGAWISPITHIFIHGSWMHLFFNTVMALSLGMFFEREFGTRRTIFFFFTCGLAGALFYFTLNPFSNVPVIGASGSLSGYFGALIILMARRGTMGGRPRSPWPLVGFWLVFMIGAGYISSASLAWQAHVGGFLTGIGLLYLIEKGKLRI